MVCTTRADRSGTSPPRSLSQRQRAAGVSWRSESQLTIGSPVVVRRRGWSVGRVLFPESLRRSVRRPSISDHRCRRPRAVHPRTRAGSPRTCAVRPCSGRGLPSRPGRPGRWWSLAPPFHPYRPGSRKRDRRAGGLFSVALSRGLLRVGVAHRPALGSPDLPRHPVIPAHTCQVPRPPDQPLRAEESRGWGRGLDKLDRRARTTKTAERRADPVRWVDPAFQGGRPAEAGARSADHPSCIS